MLLSIFASVPSFAQKEDQEQSASAAATWLRDAMPEFLRGTGFIVEHWQWIGIFFLILFGMTADRVLAAVLKSFVKRALARTQVVVDPDLLHSCMRPPGLIALAAIWWFGLALLALPSDIHGVAMIAVKFVIIAAIVWTTYRLVDVVSAILEQRAAKTATRFDDLLIPLIRKSLKVFVTAFGIVFIADNLQVNIGSLLAGLGIGGLAVAISAQDLLKNLFGSLAVLMDRPFEVGDWVLIGDIEGNVIELGFRTTRIRTFYNSVVTLPNSKLLDTPVDNMGARRYRRWKTMIGITYDTPPEKIEAFCEGIRELIRRHPYTRKDFHLVYMNQFAPSSMDILLYMFFETPDWATELRERHRFYVDIVRLARKLGVEFAFPTQTLHLHQAADGEPAALAEMAHKAELESAKEKGREEARAIVAATLGTSGEKPPPVTYQAAVAGESDEGDAGSER
ncbi:MAG: mechanosensitive ion channel family protein [Armatimonadetes bacterium]|nr:mechanosensitive ion channel family protein [Armatimonadota bacterium]